MQNEEQKAEQPTEAGMAQNPLLGAGHDPMPTEADFETMGCASNGEYFEMTDWYSYRLALAEWKKRNGVE